MPHSASLRSATNPSDSASCQDLLPCGSPSFGSPWPDDGSAFGRRRPHLTDGLGTEFVGPLGNPRASPGSAVGGVTPAVLGIDGGNSKGYRLDQPDRRGLRRGYQRRGVSNRSDVFGGLLALGAGEICRASKPDDNCCGDDQQGGEDPVRLDSVDCEGSEQNGDGQVGSGVEQNHQEQASSGAVVDPGKQHR